MIPASLIYYLRLMFGIFSYEIRTAGICILCGFLIERLARKSPASTDQSRTFNYGCTLVYFLFDSTGGMFLSIWAGALVGRLHDRLHVLQNRPGFAFAIALSLVVNLAGDLGYYWLHRLQHSSAWLWATHRVHHSDECMNVTTTFRIHWLEQPMRLTVLVLVAALLPSPHEVIPMAYALAMAHTFMNHLNAPIGFGWFNRLIVTARTHRIHHSVQPEHIDKNFAGVFSLWDVIFGTYVHPKKGEYPTTGLVPSEVPVSLRAEISYPFRRWRELWQQHPSKVQEVGNIAAGQP